MRIAKGHYDQQSPSLDRIVPKLGYTVGNVCVISQRANILKRDATPDELYAVANYMTRERSRMIREGLLEDCDDPYLFSTSAPLTP
jgi:hypothetical protein